MAKRADSVLDKVEGYKLLEKVEDREILEDSGEDFRLVQNGWSEVLAPKDWKLPVKEKGAMRTCGIYVMEQHLGDRECVPDAEFQRYLGDELWRRKESLEEAPEKGLANIWYSIKKQPDRAFEPSTLFLGGAGGMAINFFTRPSFTPGYILPLLSGLKGLMDGYTSRQIIEDFRRSLDDQAEIYEGAYHELVENGHDMEHLELSYNPILDSYRSDRFILENHGGYEVWESRGTETVIDTFREKTGYDF